MARIYPLLWEKAKLYHPDYGHSFTWKAGSRVLPMTYHVVRTPDHRYEIWGILNWQNLIDHQTWKNEGIAPIYLGKRDSATKGKLKAQLSENLLISLSQESKPGISPSP